MARSIRFLITIAKLRLAQDLDGFGSGGTPINAPVVRDVMGGNLLAHQRHVVPLGKTHAVLAIVRLCACGGVRGACCHVADRTRPV